MTANPTMDPASPEQQAPGALSIDDDGIAWLILDDPAKRVNTLSSRLFGWFSEQVARLERERPRGLVILSGKADNFVAGADIEELQGLTRPEEVLELLGQGHELTRRLDHLPFPTVAAIHGSCLGGGLELALCCDLRVASDHEKTKLGLPEVQLGLIPGMGGTQRLPRLIGVPDALDLILTGKQVSARAARRLGLVDELCDRHDLAQAALAMLAEAGEGAVAKRRKRNRAFASRAGDLLAKSFLGEKFVYDRARDQVLEKTGGHYPAPLVAVDVVKEGMELPIYRALELESGAFSELVVSDTAKNLMGIFFMKNDVEARAKKIAKAARPVETIGVLGAGFMGSGVAQVLVHKGYRVVMKDQDRDAVARGMGAVSRLFDGLVKRRRYSEVDKRQAMGRLLGTVDYRNLQRADFVVEAVFEDVGVKHRVIQETEAVAPEHLIFASNTSTIPIAELAQGSKRPENVVGMHFFSPVHKMPLIEVIRHPGTSEVALATTVEVGRRMGKTVIVVNDIVRDRSVALRVRAAAQDLEEPGGEPVTPTPRGPAAPPTWLGPRPAALVGRRHAGFYVRFLVFDESDARGAVGLVLHVAIPIALRLVIADSEAVIDVIVMGHAGGVVGTIDVGCACREAAVAALEVGQAALPIAAVALFGVGALRANTQRVGAVVPAGS